MSALLSMYTAQTLKSSLNIAFLTPANAMLSVELKNLADVLDATGQLRNVSQQAKTWSSRIHDAILKTTVSNPDRDNFTVRY